MIALADAEVDFVVVDGLAAVAHGSARLTQDLDVVYSRSPENVERLVRSLAPLQPYLRGAPAGLPFEWRTATIARGVNFTLTTTAGDVDLLGEITGGGGFFDLLPECQEIELFGRPCKCINLPKLIQVKRAAGRPKDLEAIAELEALLEERDKI